MLYLNIFEKMITEQHYNISFISLKESLVYIRMFSVNYFSYAEHALLLQLERKEKMETKGNEQFLTMLTTACGFWETPFFFFLNKKRNYLVLFVLFSSFRFILTECHKIRALKQQDRSCFTTNNALVGNERDILELFRKKKKIHRGGDGVQLRALLQEVFHQLQC